jgi:hypothetical protein
MEASLLIDVSLLASHLTAEQTAEWEVRTPSQTKEYQCGKWCVR